MATKKKARKRTAKKTTRKRKSAPLTIHVELRQGRRSMAKLDARVPASASGWPAVVRRLKAAAKAARAVIDSERELGKC